MGMGRRAAVSVEILRSRHPDRRQLRGLRHDALKASFAALLVCGAASAQTSDFARAARDCHYIRIAGRILADARQQDPVFQPAVAACEAMAPSPDGPPMDPAKRREAAADV